MIKVNYDNVLDFVEEKEILSYEKTMKKCHKSLYDGTGKGNDFVGWVSLPKDYDREEFSRIKSAAVKIQEQSEILLVIGIGGSYLGAKSAIEALKPYFNKEKELEVIFVGHHISSTYIADLIDYIDGKDFSINVISKSGTTTEPALAFRVFKEILENKYQSDAKDRIYATTDKEKGALRTLADQQGYETFVVPSNVGGRYSVLTAVGLLPIAAAGINIEDMMKGAFDAYIEYQDDSMNNEVYKYVATRNALYNSGKKIEMLINYEPALTFVSEWWKQLYGESEGKDGLGIFPASAAFSTDLHSLGQYIQDGERHLFETVINVLNVRREVVVKSDNLNLDGLNYLTGKTIDYVNKQAFLGTLIAHKEGGVPNIIIDLDEISAYSFGKLVYFFELACGVSGYVLDVNPFDQPGVEDYKKNMFALLEKPGYEELTKNIKKKIK